VRAAPSLVVMKKYIPEPSVQLYHVPPVGRASSNSISIPPKATDRLMGNQPPPARAEVTLHQLTTHAVSNHPRQTASSSAEK
jgi:hypothetical protein